MRVRRGGFKARSDLFRAGPGLFPVVRMLLLTLLLWPALAAAQGPKAPGFQLQLDGLVYSPNGTLASQGGEQLSALLPSGPGFALTGSLGIARRWAVAARVAYFGSSQDQSFHFADGVPPAGPYPLERELHVTNVHALFQYRHPLGEKFQWELEAGAGVSQAREKLRLANDTGEKASAVGVQLDPSYAAGAALGYRTGWNTDVVGGFRWSLTSSSDGAVWSSGDSPAYANWTLGLRYPHETH
jgi:hypothetical protein